MSFNYGKPGVDKQVDVHKYLSSHQASAQAMPTLNLRYTLNSLNYRLLLFG